MTCREIKKKRNAWPYKRVSLWTEEIQISETRNKFKLLYTNSVFNLSNGGSVMGVVTFLVMISHP